MKVVQSSVIIACTVWRGEIMGIEKLAKVGSIGLQVLFLPYFAVGLGLANNAWLASYHPKDVLTPVGAGGLAVAFWFGMLAWMNRRRDSDRETWGYGPPLAMLAGSLAGAWLGHGDLAWPGLVGLALTVVTLALPVGLLVAARHVLQRPGG